MMINYCITCENYDENDLCDVCEGTENNHVFYEPDFVKRKNSFTKHETGEHTTDDLISRQDAIDRIQELISEENDYTDLYYDGYVDCAYDAEDVLKALQSAQPEQKKGRWVKHKNWYACSECGTEMFFSGTYDESQHYCYNCGARMDGENNA